VSDLRLPPGVVERPDGTLEAEGVRVRARRGTSIRACVELAADILGDTRLSTGRQLAALAGALPGMRLTVAPDRDTDLLMEVRGGGYFARRILYRGRDDLKVVLNARLDAQPQGQGLGTASQVIQAAAALRLGVDLLEAVASSVDGDVGYLVLPRWGYDALLEGEEFLEDLPTEWSGLRRLVQVLEQPGGWAWWREHGCILWVHFDLREHGAALQRLRSYLDRRLAAGRPMPTRVPPL
jgi:hypothetical protein